jgi:hypothetical protein
MTDPLPSSEPPDSPAVQSYGSTYQFTSLTTDRSTVAEIVITTPGLHNEYADEVKMKSLDKGFDRYPTTNTLEIRNSVYLDLV